MKRKILFIIILILFSTGCKETKTEPPKIEEYYLEYNESEIRLNTNFVNIIATLGKYNDSVKTDNELSEQTGSIYTYDDFEIETYFKDNTEKIYSFWFTGDNIKTNEGIKLGDNIDKVIEIYGAYYDNTDKDVYLYEQNNTSISFITENNIIVSIQYLYLENS